MHKAASMNPNVGRLYNIAQQPSRLVIGLMSGTSVDGLDVALCRCTGAGLETMVEILHFETVAYDKNFKAEVKAVFSRKDADLEKVCLLNSWIALQHAQIILQCLKEWELDPADIDLIASHGQTIYHAPKFLHRQDQFSNATLQIGDGDHIAVNTGIITVSDFRQKHIAAGGEGAPLAVYGDYLVFSKAGENRIMLNIGGIANFTFLAGDLDAAKVFSTDTGTGNTLMDAYVQGHFPGKYCDEGAEIAAAGKVNEALLSSLKENNFFHMGFPKTTGPELFNIHYLEKARVTAGTGPLSHEDVMATLNRFSADTISEAIKRIADELETVVIYVSGGGMHNPLLMDNLRKQLPGYTFNTTEQLGINPDAKEAVLFAVLANECVAGGNIRVGNGNTGIPFVSMGKISFPV